MLTSRAAARWLPSFRGLLATGISIAATTAHAGTSPIITNAVEIVVIQGTVEVARGGQPAWDLASTQLPYRRLNAGDQIRTQNRSRATLRLSDLTIVELGPNAHLELLRPEDRRTGFSLLRGLLHLFHRDKPGEYYFRTPTASPVIRGTEFNLEVTEDGATTLRLLEGEVALTNALGGVDMKSGDAALVQPGRAPMRTAALEAVNVIQWCLYYPAVLHLDELQLSADERNALADSLAGYRQGDLLAALAKYPQSRQPNSDHERIYLAALLLGVGEGRGAEGLMKSLTGTDYRATQLATGLRTLIAAVKAQPMPAATTGTSGTSASIMLAESYHHQSRFDLASALASARQAVDQAPEFAFAWARVAELEFGFGRTDRASAAVDRAAQLAPRHAQALAVKGFLLAAQNRIGPAVARFEEAMAVDGHLANAWLGRGLCRIRQGDTREGMMDLLLAASLEPNRALLRSYLGKAFDQVGDDSHAARELDRARELDPLDPTAWLYSALLNQQDNRVNDAIRDLERSQALNDNRQLYRSRLLLDQDRAVRQANLAAVYQDAGLFDHSVREAARAVGSDYANHSAHLFLANSYAQRGEVTPVNLRYETVIFSEYLLAQLLAPVGGGALSSYVSQQEYSRLFQRDGFGVSAGTEYRSTGDWRQRAAQYGTFGNFDYALDAYYASLNGQRPNNDSEQLTLSAAVRFPLSPQDTVFVQAVDTEFESGDLRQYYSQTSADPLLRVKESQEPNLFAGYHRTWGPGSHTLLLLGRLHDDFQLRDPDTFVPTLRRDYLGVYDDVPEPWSHFSNRQRSVFVAYSAELQHIWHCADNTLIVGGRFQDGDNTSDAELAKLPPTFGNLSYPPDAQQVDTQLRRAVLYVYDHWELLDKLWLIGGVSYDRLSFPENTDLPPITNRHSERDQVSPKAGVIWLPATNTLLRASYTRSLGGLYYDNSVRLEPTHVAGFNQAFRSLIPESVGGLVAGTEFETAGLDVSWRLPTATYIGVGVEWLRSGGSRIVGVFDSPASSSLVVTSGTPQRLEFEEKSLTVNVNQLLGRDWAIGARYRVSQADLSQRMTEVIADLQAGDLPLSRVPYAVQEDAAVLHELDLSARYSHPCGFFAEAQALWFAQDNRDLPDEDFWQFNVFAGYRFAKRRAELRVGGLNLPGRDYRLNPLNLHAELPRERTLLVSFKFNF